MNWFVAKIVYNINLEKGMYAPEFDEQLRLIEANSKDEAFIKARSLGKEGEESFLMNDKRTTIHWEFIDVAELFELKLNDGSEIYASTLETETANKYIHFVKEKAALLANKNLAIS